ncbi:MAG: lysophospholipid acyltransferase family protein [Proteobacteria bacterium]|nr:lysophospholipid acyltransferase family protein [Pseudomonadota bacterium]
MATSSRTLRRLTRASAADESLISVARAGNPDHPVPAWLRLAAPAIDRLIGAAAIDRRYRTCHARGLPPLEFASEALQILGIEAHVDAPRPAAAFPASGPVIVVSNHPYGAVEALVLARWLRTIRTDVRFLANSMLGVFAELRPALIGTQPLAVSHANGRSIRRCQGHLQSGGVLVMFPAGKVSIRHAEDGRYADAPWNRLVGHLAKSTGATVVPAHFHGGNRRFFNLVGRVWERGRMALLARELLALRGRTVRCSIGRGMNAGDLRDLDDAAATGLARLGAYLVGTIDSARPAPTTQIRESVAAATAPGVLEREIAELPKLQTLVTFKHFTVHWANALQIPALLPEIARERERVFREHAEGSGMARDSDRFDASYIHLFAWDHRSHSLVGAYRLGRTDELIRRDGPGALYLNQMFEFDPTFHASQASLELGRSFVAPEHQRSFHALYLLWRGIGQYLLQNPKYTRLYGTVSLSRRYPDQAIAALCDALIVSSAHVRARHALRTIPHPEWRQYRADGGSTDLRALSALVRSVDPEGKDIPVLLRHYHGLGARFLSVGVDPNFSETPGLLLAVDIAGIPRKTLDSFMGEGAGSYLDALRVRFSTTPGATA